MVQSTVQPAGSGRSSPVRLERFPRDLACIRPMPEEYKHFYLETSGERQRYLSKHSVEQLPENSTSGNKKNMFLETAFVGKCHFGEVLFNKSVLMQQRQEECSELLVRACCLIPSTLCVL